MFHISYFRFHIFGRSLSLHSFNPWCLRVFVRAFYSSRLDADMVSVVLLRSKRQYLLKGINSMKRMFLVLAATLTLISLANAQIPAEKVAETEKMFELMGIDKQLKGGFEAMLPVVDQLAQQYQLTPDQKEEMKNIYRAWWDTDIDRKSMKEKMVKLYADTFTLEELKDLNKFYQSPIGKKFLEVSPVLMQEGARIGMDEASAKEANLLKRLTPFFEKIAK